MLSFVHHLFRAMNGYVQKWTNQNVPSSCQILHNFGNGPEPASPLDKSAIRNDVTQLAPIPVGRTTASLRNDIVGVTRIVTNSHQASIRNDVLSMEAV